ncbi:MAG: ATP synthase F1 subunit delta [Chitinophagales bacterium]|nr:ATP synthase F1 subunit delta [Chitinophagales bacterium]MDW8419684.1 ATP synthase F1 subunit delta [Chitinophagales bacterium]
MSAYRIASRYAKSLIELAQEKGSLDAVHQDIITLDTAFENSREFRALFRSPIIHSDKKQAIFDRLFKDKISEIVYRFVTLLIKKGREAYLHDIANSFIEQYNVIKHITKVKITTAIKLDTAVVQKLMDGLKKKENLELLDVTEEVDESIIGGFIIRYGDKQIDSSVRRRLMEFRAVVDDDSYIKKY